MVSFSSMSSENFQKELVWIQIAATGLVVLGTIMIILGLAMMSLFYGISLSETIREQFDVYVKVILSIGLGIIVLGIVLLYWKIKRV
jgi:hypothetical protein